MRYQYHHEPKQGKYHAPIAITTTLLDPSDNAGHGDHWAILSDNPTSDLPRWLQASLEKASVPTGLASAKTCDKHLVVASNDTSHIKQVFALQDGNPSQLLNVYPAINSPYGLMCRIQEIIACPDSQDAILHLNTKDGTSIYAFDTLYPINHCHYDVNTRYYVNLAAWAYHIDKSREDEVILVEDPDAIRYHRAFNDIVSANGGIVPDDLDARIKAWQPPSADALAPVEINLGHSCIYLFGETFGQEDEAWCQGQVLGKSYTQFFDKDITLFDVVILREPDADPFVVRIGALTSPTTERIAVHDYIQANIWLQAAIYAETQHTPNP
ncbi:MAG: hypothetical protein Q4C68_02015 [Moraxella sp.]|nr:hypothetical protein [Moraxella sp.]